MMVVASMAAGLAAQTPPAGRAAAPPGTPARQGAPPASPAPPPAPPPSPEAVARASEILKAARQALGGDKLAAIKTLVASGQTKRVRGNNLVPIEFEIDLALPDKYLRKDESPAEETDPTSTGFNGDALIQVPAPVVPTMPARPGGPPPGPGSA